MIGLVSASTCSVSRRLSDAAELFEINSQTIAELQELATCEKKPDFWAPVNDSLDDGFNAWRSESRSQRDTKD
jgi:hypothetical protein